MTPAHCVQICEGRYLPAFPGKSCSIDRRAQLPRRNSERYNTIDDQFCNISAFKPATITISTIFKQVRQPCFITQRVRLVNETCLRAGGGVLKSLWDVPTLLALLNLSVKSSKLVLCSGENSLNMLFPWDTRWHTTDREVCTFSWALSHLLIRHAIPSVSSVAPQKWNPF